MEASMSSHPVSLAPASATSTPAAVTPARARAGAVLDVDRRAYCLLACGIVGLYLIMWLTHFQYVYGALVDDYSIWYVKGVKTIEDWRNAFGAYAPDLNFAQVYFFVVSYLPLKSGIGLPSYPLPMLGEQTGQFRFFLLYMVGIHAVTLGLWAWFATYLTGSRLAALLSLFLFATSPTLLLWSPEPDSRMIGLPIVLVGMWLLLRVAPIVAARGWPGVGYFFLAGSVFGLANCVHWASLYLFAPVAAAFWGVWLWLRWRRLDYWHGVIGFGLGSIWLFLLMEVISDFAARIPFDQGPLMTLLWIRNIHVSPWSRLGNLALWSEWFLSQMGPLLLLAIAAGGVLYFWKVREAGGPPPVNRWIVGLTVVLALGYLVLAGTMPFFRQTGVLQPFLFLFASLAIVYTARRLARSTAVQGAIVIALVVAVGAIQWEQAQAVFQAHQSLGQALDWAYTHKGDRPLAWLRIAWFGGTTEVENADDLAQLPAGTWLLSYFPWYFASNNLSLRPAFEATRPVGAWPSLYATDMIRAETKPYGHNDLRTDPLLRDVLITDVDTLRAQLRGQPLAVQSVTADSVAMPSAEPANVLDRDRSPDGVTDWISAPTGMPHTLDIQFAAPTEIGALRVVLPALDNTPGSNYSFASRISAMQVQAADPEGTYHTVWAGQHLEGAPVVSPTWAAAPTAAVRLVIQSQAYTQGPADAAMIEEVEFPGYEVTAPPLTRAFPDLTLQDLRLTEQGLVVGAAGLTPHTALIVSGQRLAIHTDTGLPLVRLPESLRTEPDSLEAYLTDDLRRSNTVRVTVAPPTLRAIQPAATPVDVGFNVQPDGSSALTIDSANATPGTVAMWDTIMLPTAIGPNGEVTATVPGEFLTAPGHHAVRLKNALGDSEPLDFAVEPAGEAP